MKNETKNRLKRTAMLSLIALVVGGVIGLVQINAQKARVSDQGSRTIEPVAGVQVGGPFALVDHNEQAVTQEDFADQAKLIYFGFTYCPAICPTELQKMTRVLDRLGTRAESIQPIFVTIDPERDTPEVMKEYLQSFYPEFVGLTGSRAQIDAVKKNYRVFAKRVDDPALSDYTMDHSSYIYLMSADDELLSMYRTQDDVEYMLADIKARL
jgi:protein SCO1/2